MAVLMITTAFIPAVSALEPANNTPDAAFATGYAAGMTTLTDGTTTLFVDDSGGADFTTIQAAVNAASDGDTIVVKDGAYAENVVVNKSVAITSENGAGATTVTAASSSSPVFYVTADDVTIAGFCVSGSGGYYGAAYLAGDNCTITSNILTGNGVGIYADCSANAVLSGNTISSNSDGGIWLVGTNSVTVDGNFIDSNGGEGGIYLDCIYDTVIRNNTISNNSYAIFLEDWGDDSNAIYLNTFENNEPETFLWGEHLSWQSPEPITYSYNGQSYTSLLGNCWGTYTGTDADGDGVGDTPYAISASAQDTHPLMGSWQDGSIASSTSGTTTLFVDDSGGADFTTIQAAVNAASDGDTIVVKDGAYAENVVVNKNVAITSENGSSATTVTAASSSSPVFYVTADNVTITGFCISASEGYSGAIYLAGDNCTITSNILTGNVVGICVGWSSNAVLTGNTISSNSNGGIWLEGANSVTVDGNFIDSNGYYGGIYIDCIYNSVIRNNTISNNSYAISLEDWSDDSNAVYLNTFRNNAGEVPWGGEHLIWQSPEPVTYSYSGQSYTSLLGNCWGTYTGTDADGDGIGDTPYAISASAQDTHPLMGSWQDGSIAFSAGSTAITVTSPIDDTVASGNITVAGNVSDSAITTLTLTHNGVQSVIPVQDGNFSAVVNLTTANTIVISGVDSQGISRSTTLLLDGDMLPASFEEEIGFDPLDPDSDCSQTEEDESSNGIIDGYEIFDGKLPVFAKYRIGADPFVEDTDGNGLTDYFELTKLGVIQGEPSQSVQTALMSTSGNDPYLVNSGTGDDPDEDGLSNLDEQTYGTDPLSADTDRDGLSDAEEIQQGTDPCDADSDDDGLTDDCELILGTNPGNADSNGNGVQDGDEDYQSQKSFLNDTVELTVFGRGYAIENASVAEVNYTDLISDEILVSGVYDVALGQNISSGELKIRYDSAHVNQTSNLSIYQFNNAAGTFIPVQSVVDAPNEIVSCNVTNSSKYTVLNSLKWDALFEDPAVEADLAESVNILSEEEYLDEEHYIPAVNECYPLETPQEVELIEGMDYGAFTYNETPEWLIEEENESEANFETENHEITDYIGSGEFLVTNSGEEVLYQAVSNGDFSSGMVDWAPCSSVYDEGANYGHEIDTYDEDYSSSPPYLSIFLWNNGHVEPSHGYEVAHANVDLSGVDTLTFKYKCSFIDTDPYLTSCRLLFKIDGQEEFRFPTTSFAYVTDDWQSQAIDVSDCTGMHTISFYGYLSYGGTSSSYGRSRVQFLIDDVSAWSVLEPAGPDAANVRFFVQDSRTGEGVGPVSVYCNHDTMVKRTDSNGYTNDFYFYSSGIWDYRVEAAGYKNHEGSIKVTLGESKVVDAIINGDNAPTGEIRVVSTPDHATIYVDGIYSGGTNSIVTDLLAGDHVVEVRKEGYSSALQTVEVHNNERTDVNFDLTAETGSLQVTSSQPGARVYLDNTYQGTTSESETTGVLTLPTVMVGNRTVKVVKNDYAPFTANVTIEKDQTTYLTATLNNDDLEGDGLLDYDEEHGYRDGFGRWHTTDPNLIDTDGDGLSDGFEAGETVTENGKTFRKQRSDPTKADTDDDGLDDMAELGWGTDPFNPDSDGDGLLDGVDPEPTKPEGKTVDLSLAEIGRAIILGAVFGETGLPGGYFHGMVGDEIASSPYYMVGWIGFSCLPAVGGIADIRDAVQAIINGDAVGAAMNAAGAIPGPGDGVKVTGAVACFTGKYPWKARDLGVILSKEIMPLLPDVLKHDIWKVCLSTRENTIITKLIDEGYSVSQIQEMVVSPLGLTGKFLKKNIDEYNNYEGNLQPYQAILKKSVIGTYASYSGSTPYTKVGIDQGANYLNFVSTPDWRVNEKYLDIIIDNTDEIVLSVHPNAVPPGDGVTFKKEIDYLTRNGYRISDYPNSDGLYRMIRPEGF